MAGNNSGAMVALLVPDPENYALQGFSEDDTAPEELHITLAYMGDASELSAEQRAAILDSAQVLADTTDAPEALFPATTGVFPPDPESADPDPKAPYFAAPSNDEKFNNLREDLMTHFAARGVADTVSTKHPVFHPHVTLTYSALDNPPPLDHLPTPLPTRFHTIVVKFGDEKHEFELGQPAEGPELALTASVRSAISNLSHRLEQPEDFLTALYLRQRQVRSTPAQTRAQAALEVVTASVDPHYRSSSFRRVELLAERANKEVSPASRAFAANRALALASRTVSPSSVTEARQLSALTASLRALVADGNSSVARSLRARQQLRDRYGRWIEMGGGVRFKVREPGAPGGGKWYHGIVTGFDIPNGRVNVELPDGRTVAIPNNKIEQPKAVLNMGIGDKLKSAVKTFNPRSKNRKAKASLPTDHNPDKEAADKVQDDAAVAAMDGMQKDLAAIYPDATVSGGNIAPLVNDPNLKAAEAALGPDFVAGPVSFVPTKKPAGTANKDAEVTLDIDDVKTVRAALDRLTQDYTPSETDLEGLSEEEQKKARQTARSKAYGRLATLYNERGADQDLVRAPSVGTDDQLEEATTSTTPDAPKQTEIEKAINDAFDHLDTAVADNHPLSAARDKILSSLSEAGERWNSGQDDDETFAQNLDTIKEYANAQEPSFVPSYSQLTDEQKAFGSFAEDLDDIHAAIGGKDNVDAAKSALFDVMSATESEAQAEDKTEDGSPYGWSDTLTEINTDANSIYDQIGTGEYLNKPEDLATLLDELNATLAEHEEEFDAETFSEVTKALSDASQNLKTLPGDAPDTSPDTDESKPDEVPPTPEGPSTKDIAGPLPTTGAHKYRTKIPQQMSKRDLAREMAQSVLDSAGGYKGDTSTLDESKPEHKKLVDAWTRGSKEHLIEQVVALRAKKREEAKNGPPAEKAPSAPGQGPTPQDAFPQTPETPDEAPAAPETSNATAALLADQPDDARLSWVHGIQTELQYVKNGNVWTVVGGQAPYGTPNSMTDEEMAEYLKGVKHANLYSKGGWHNDDKVGVIKNGEVPATDAPAADAPDETQAEADAAAPGTPEDYTDAPEGATDSEKASWNAFSEASGAVYDLLDNPDDETDTPSNYLAPSTVEGQTALDQYNSLLNGWYEDAPTDPAGLSEYADKVEAAGLELKGALGNDPQYDSELLSAFEEANNSFVSAVRAQAADSPASEPETEDSSASPNLETFQELNAQLMDLHNQIPEGHELHENVDAAASDIQNVGMGVQNGTMTPEEGAENLAEMLQEVTDLYQADAFGPDLEGTPLGDDLDAIMLDVQKAADSLAAGKYDDGTTSEEVDAPEAPEAVDGAQKWDELTDEQRQAFITAGQNLTQWINDRESELNDEPDYESGQGAGFVEPVQAQQGIADFKQYVDSAIESFIHGEISKQDLIDTLQQEMSDWLGSEGYKQVSAFDEDGIAAESYDPEPFIDDVISAVGASKPEPEQPEDPWAGIPLSPPEIDVPKADPDELADWEKELLGYMDEAPTTSMVETYLPEAVPAFEALTDAASSDQKDEETAADAVNAANVLSDKLEAAIDADETDDEDGSEALTFLKGLLGDTHDLIEAIEDGAVFYMDEMDSPDPEKDSEISVPGPAMQGIVNQLSETDSPLAKFLASHLQDKLDNNETFSDDDLAAIQQFFDWTGSAPSASPQEKAESVIVHDVLEPGAVAEAEATEITPDIDESVPDSTTENVSSDPEVFNADGALETDAAKAAWADSLAEFNAAGGSSTGPTEVVEGSNWNPLSDAQTQNLQAIINDLPSELQPALQDALDGHGAGVSVSDDQLIATITNTLFDVPYGNSKLRGRLRGAQAGIQTNSSPLVPILRPKPDAYNKPSEDADLYLAGPAEVKATVEKILEQAASGADLAGLSDEDNTEDAEVKAKIASAAEQLQDALDAMAAGDVDGMVGSMRIALDEYDDAIALRAKAHKQDKIIRRLRARRRALDEVLAGFEGRWADPVNGGTYQAYSGAYDYDPKLSFTDKDGNDVYPGDQIQRTHKTAAGQTGIVLGWRGNSAIGRQAKIWLDQEKKTRDQGVAQDQFIVSAVGPNNPLYHDPDFKGARVGDETLEAFAPVHAKAKEAADKKAAKQASVETAEKLAAPEAPAAPAADPFVELFDIIDNATSPAELYGVQNMIDSADLTDSQKSVLSDVLSKRSTQIKNAMASDAVTVGSDLAGDPEVLTKVKALPEGSQLQTTSYTSGTDYDIWTKGSDGHWHSQDGEGMTSEYFEDEGLVAVLKIGGEEEENDGQFVPADEPDEDKPVFHEAENKGKEANSFTAGGHWGEYGAAGIAVVAVDPADGKTKVLLGHRNDHDQWYLPGGAIDELETPIQGATREFHEEVMGGDQITPNLSLTDTHEFVDENDGNWTYTTLVANLPETVDIQAPDDAPSYEFDEYHWFDADELEKLDTSGMLHKSMTEGKFSRIIGFPTSLNSDTTYDTQSPENFTDFPAPADLSSIKYDMSTWKMVSGSKGSTAGGVYEDEDGNRYYAKVGKTQNHAHNEVLASHLYEILGVPTTEARLGMLNGTYHIVTPWVHPSTKTVQQAVQSGDSQILDQIKAGFAVDAWLGNYDAVGPSFTNIIINSNGEAVHVDSGAALLYRGTGGKKTWWGDTPVEINEMRKGYGQGNSSSYSAAQQIFGQMTDAEIKASAAKLAQFSPKEIEGVVNATGFSAAKKKELTNTLIQRRHKILEQYGLLTAQQNVAKDTTDKAITQTEQAAALAKAQSSQPAFEVGNVIKIHNSITGKEYDGDWDITEVLANGYYKVISADDGETTKLVHPSSAKASTAPPADYPDGETGSYTEPTPGAFAFAANGHSFVDGEKVMFLDPSTNVWKEGELAKIGGSNVSLDSVDKSYFASVKAVNEGGFWYSVPIKNVHTPESHAGLVPNAPAPAPTTASMSLGEGYATMPEGAIPLKKRKFDNGGSNVLVQHPDGKLYVYNSSGKAAISYKQNPDSYKAENDWFDFPTDLSSLEETVVPHGAGTYATPPEGSKTLYKTIDPPVPGAPVFVVQHEDGSLHSYGWQGMVTEIVAEPFNSLDYFAETTDVWEPVNGAPSGAPSPATMTPAEDVWALPANPEPVGSTDLPVDSKGNPIAKGDTVLITKYLPKDAVTNKGRVVQTYADGKVKIQFLDEDGKPVLGPGGSPKTSVRDGKNMKVANPPVKDPSKVDNTLYKPENTPDGLVFSAADIENPLFGTPAPEQPESPHSPDVKFVDDAWVAEADAQYRARLASKGKEDKPVQSSAYWSKYQAAMKGNVQELDFLLSNGYIDQKLYDSAKEQVDAAAFAHGQKIASYQKELEDHAKLFAEWKAANGAPSVVPVNPEEVPLFTSSEAYKYMEKNYGEQQVSSSVSSALGTVKGSSSWTSSIRKMSQLLPLGRDEVVKLVGEGSHSMQVWDALASMVQNPKTKLKEPLRVTRTLQSWRLSSPDGTPMHSGDDMSELVGTIQKEFSSMEVTPGGQYGYTQGDYDTYMDITIPAGVHAAWTGGGEWGFSGSTSEMGLVLEPGLAMYIWDVEKSPAAIPHTGNPSTATKSKFKWKVTASIIPAELLPYMDGFAGPPSSSGQAIVLPNQVPDNLPTSPLGLIPGTTTTGKFDANGNYLGNDGSAQDVYDGSLEGGYDGTAKSSNDGTEVSDNDGS